MEWMLQVADEIDDVIGALRLCSVGLGAEIGLALSGVLALGAIVAAVATGAQLVLLCAVGVVLGAAAALKIHALQFPAGR
jgi:hypothetical protein